jgi:hypothetical protein
MKKPLLNQVHLFLTLLVTRWFSNKVFAQWPVFDFVGHRYCARFGLDNDTNHSVDVSNWPAGLYLVLIETTQGKAYQLKFIVQH